MYKNYDTAINGYQFHVKRYHDWINFYSIFNGALFVALYNMWGCSAEKMFFISIVAALGLIASLCWLYSHIGHYTWMKSWIKVVQNAERQLIELKSKAAADSNVPNNNEAPKDSQGSHDRSENGVYTVLYLGKNVGDGNGDYEKGFLSTQKITAMFIKAVIVAWLLVNVCLIIELCCMQTPCFVKCISIIVMGLAILFAIVLVICYFNKISFISSNLSGMTKK